MRKVTIHCPYCAELRAKVHGDPFLLRTETFAMHVHTSKERRGKLVYGKARCWNQCIDCGTRYETVACGASERRRRRRAERLGQLSLFSQTLRRAVSRLGAPSR